ncbi:MAG: hypothetical protein PQJ50_08560 [Spirochaetales bacterium]|nr:hypothetical protein [Spirochaetales bacterium]
MPLKRFFQVSLLLLVLQSPLWAQYAPGVDWKKIETEHFQLIFPAEITERALELAPRVEAVYRLEQQDFTGGHEKKWPLILTTSGMISNGYVSLAPRKSVWYGTPASEGLSSLDWYDLLNLHETRHMVQMDSLNRNFIRFLYFLGGELGQAGGIYLSVPRWFLEGDAVHAETVYSESGRGRDPLFYTQMKVLTLEGGRSYQNFVNGSYRDHYPNYYSYGYFMTSYIRKIYGDDAWNRILDSATTLPLPALGLYLGAQEVTGKSWTRLFQDMLDDLKTSWEEEMEGMDLREDEVLLDILPDEYTRYEVLYADEESLIARKSSVAEPASLIRIENGREEKIRRVPAGEGITSSGSSFIWTWNRPSLLYEDRSWSDLILYESGGNNGTDGSSGGKRYITGKERLYDPAFSPDGKRVAVMHWSEEMTGELRILDPRNGEVLNSYDIKEKGFPSSPAWSDDGKRVYLIFQTESGRSLKSIDLSSGIHTTVKEAVQENIKDLQVWNSWLIYGSNAGGYENIMAWDSTEGREYRITSRALAAENPLVAGDVLYYSDTRNSLGNIPVRVPLDPDYWIPVDPDRGLPGAPFSTEADWSIHNLPDWESAGMENLEVDDYSVGTSGLNLHSWGISPNLETLTGLRLQLQSANVMNTLNLALGAEFDINERTWGGFLDLDWTRFYPVISLRNSADYRVVGGTEMMDLSNRVMLSFPMNLSRDLWHFYLTPAVSTGLRSFLPLNGEDSEYYVPVEGQLIAAALLPGSSRSIVPAWGFIERAGASVYPEDPSELYRIYTRTSVYTPGPFRNTGLTWGLALEEQSGRYSLSFPFARGYSSSVDYRTLKASADYDFPIAYPDFAAGSFFYLKRIRGNLFYDYLVQGDLPVSGERYQSVGAALVLDMTAANMEYGEFDLAFRFCWLVEEERPVFQLLFMNAALW